MFVGEEALMRKLKEMQKENEKLKKKLEEVSLTSSYHFFFDILNTYSLGITNA